MNTRLKPTLIGSAILLAFISQQASATNGYASHGFGLTQKAMGGAAVAGHDNAMNIATNPASMSFGENNWTVGLDIFVPDRGANYAATAGGAVPAGALGPGFPAFNVPDGGPGAAADLSGNDDSNFPIPEFAYQRKLNNKYSVGIAAYGNGGMNATYGQSIFGPRFQADGQTPINPDASPAGPNTGIDFAQLFLAPSVSMKVNQNHAIGASLNLVYQRLTINGVGGFAAFSRDPSNLSDNDYDNSTGAGVSLGWQGQFGSKFKAGLAYRSETKMSKFDKYKGLLAEQGDFDIPSMITAGISFQASPKTTVAVDVARINYTDVKAISNPNNTAPLLQQFLSGDDPKDFKGPKLGDDSGAGFGWEDQNIFKIGIKHQLNNKVTLMGGWNHGKSPIGEDDTAFNVLAPATVEDHITLGMDWKLTPKSKLTLSYMHAFSNEIKGDGSQSPAGFNSPGAIVNNGPNPLTNATPANIEMSQDSFGVAYTRDF